MSELKPCPFCGEHPYQDELGNALCGNDKCILFNYRMSIYAWNNRPYENTIKAQAVRDAISSVSYKGEDQYDVLRQLECHADKIEKGEP